MDGANWMLFEGEERSESERGKACRNISRCRYVEVDDILKMARDFRRASWLQGFEPGSGSWMPRFSHRRSLQFHVPPRFSVPSFNDTDNTNSDSAFCFLTQSSHVHCYCNQRVMVSQDIDDIQSMILSMHGLAQRHTAQTFGRDPAAISANSHTDWLSVACPCRLPPIQNHERLRADSIQRQ